MAIWGEFESWTYEYFELDEPTSTFEGAESFVELWNVKRGNNTLPKWTDYDWDDFAPWWGSVSISDITYDPLDYYYRLYGTKVVNLTGGDLTGQKASEIYGEEYFETVCRDYYGLIC